MTYDFEGRSIVEAKVMLSVVHRLDGEEKRWALKDRVIAPTARDEHESVPQLDLS